MLITYINKVEMNSRTVSSIIREGGKLSHMELESFENVISDWHFCVNCVSDFSWVSSIDRISSGFIGITFEYELWFDLNLRFK